jgi:hypothetical protein
MTGFEFVAADGKPLDEATKAVLDALAAGMDELTVGRSVADHIEAWNEQPLERRRQLAERLLGRELPESEVSNVGFVFSGGNDVESNIEIAIRLVRPIQYVTMSFSVDTDKGD